MEDNASPMVLRRRLRAELLAAREEKELTQQNVARAMDWSLSKINRIERGKSGISTNDLKVLVRYYGITDVQRVEQLLDLARRARKNPWWHSYQDVASRELLSLIDYESAASAINQFEAAFVPGIAQTEDYAAAVLQVFNDNKTDAVVQRLVELRIKREQLLSIKDAPEFRFVLDEAVIRRRVGSTSLMRQQLEKLARFAMLPNVKIQVMPFAAGLHRGMGSFEIVNFEDTPDEGIVFVEGSRRLLSRRVQGYSQLLRDLRSNYPRCPQSRAICTAPRSCKEGGLTSKISVCPISIRAYHRSG